MSEIDQITYVAVVTISLPGVDRVATAHVALAPGDSIPAGGARKRLHDCTLADLRAFAEELEAEVWETYQAIRLIDLARDEQAKVDLTVLDEAGQPVMPPAEWFQKAVILPATITTAMDANLAAPEEPAAEVTAGEAEAPATEPVSSPAEPESEPAAAVGEADGVTGRPEPVSAEPALAAESFSPPVTIADPQAAADLANIVVSEPEAVHDETEDGAEARVAGWAAGRIHDVDRQAEPGIIPSQARVRVAGRLRPPGDTTWAAVDILIDEPALRATQAHALSSPDREVAGVLVGPRPEKQPDGRYLVHIIDTIIAKYTVMHGASVTYTPESWRYLNDKLAERYPDETAVMVGWYHTHPGFGIFLSGMDLFIHQNFFTQIWHVAFVLDPRARASGFFCWDRQKSRVSLYDFPWPDWANGSW